MILMEIDPEHQKTLPDFLLTEKLLGIATVDITEIEKRGNELFYDRGGQRTPIRRIYNRAIVDELVRKKLKLSFNFTDDLEVEWAGHPNWYFRMSKFSLPFLRHECVPKTSFLDRVEPVPQDLENYVIKPLFSFAGLGVILNPTKEDLANIPKAKRSQYILQERMQFEPVIETPLGGTKAEIRIMYIWLDELLPVMTIVRMGRGLMMGVDHNKNMQWVGSSAGFYLSDGLVLGFGSKRSGHTSLNRNAECVKPRPLCSHMGLGYSPVELVTCVVQQSGDFVRVFMRHLAPDGRSYFP